MYLHLVILIRSFWCSYSCYLTDACSHCNFHINIWMPKKLVHNQCFLRGSECILHWLGRRLFHPRQITLNLLHSEGKNKGWELSEVIRKWMKRKVTTHLSSFLKNHHLRNKFVNWHINLLCNKSTTKEKVRNQLFTIIPINPYLGKFYNKIYWTLKTIIPPGKTRKQRQQEIIH